nr:hypothetical protein [Tanacetum cinerariifolium]
DSVLVDQRFLDDENLRGGFTVVDNYHLYTLYFPHDVPDVVSFLTISYVIHRPPGLYRHNFTFYASDWAVVLLLVYFLLPDPRAFVLGASVYWRTMLVDGYRFVTRMPLPHELTHHLHLFQSMHGRVVNSVFYIFVTTHGTPPDQIQPVHYQPSVYIFRYDTHIGRWLPSIRYPYPPIGGRHSYRQVSTDRLTLASLPPDYY